jgi:hypothetical protein
MKKKYTIIFLFFSSGVLFSFLPATPPSSKDNIKKFFVTRFGILSQNVRLLQEVVEKDQAAEVIRERFSAARSAYKQIEFILEYYYELDVSKINGPGIDFVEEEDPLAFHEPQGFQMIESFL